MGDRKFSEPIYLVLSGLGNFRADSAWEAFEYLDLHWPAARTADYRRVKALCRMAIDGVIPAEMPRRALLTLALSAGLVAAGPSGIAVQRRPPYRFTPKRERSGAVHHPAGNAPGAGLSTPREPHR